MLGLHRRLRFIQFAVRFSIARRDAARPIAGFLVRGQFGRSTPCLLLRLRRHNVSAFLATAFPSAVPRWALIAEIETLTAFAQSRVFAQSQASGLLSEANIAPARTRTLQNGCYCAVWVAKFRVNDAGIVIAASW